MYVKIISRDSLPISHPHGFRSDLKVDRAYNSKPRRMGNWKCGTCVRGRFIHCHCRSFRKGHCYRRMVKRENCPSLRLVFIARIRRCCNGTRGGRECLPCGYTHTRACCCAPGMLHKDHDPLLPLCRLFNVLQFSKIVSKRVQSRICVHACP